MLSYEDTIWMNNENRSRQPTRQQLACTCNHTTVSINARPAVQVLHLSIYVQPAVTNLQLPLIALLRVAAFVIVAHTYSG
jgi:hypothetical protein